MRRGEGEGAELVVGELLAGAPQVLRLGEDALGDRDHLLAGLGDCDQALAVASEHLDAELVLERADLLRDAGLRGVQRLGRLGNVQPPAHDFGEIAKLLEFHACGGACAAYPAVAPFISSSCLMPYSA